MPASAQSLGASLVTMLLRKSVDRGDLDHVDPPRSAFIGPNRCTADGARGVAARVDVRAPLGGHRAIGRCRHNQDTHPLVCTLSLHVARGRSEDKTCNNFPKSGAPEPRLDSRAGPA